MAYGPKRREGKNIWKGKKCISFKEGTSDETFSSEFSLIRRNLTLLNAIQFNAHGTTIIETNPICCFTCFFFFFCKCQQIEFEHSFGYSQSREEDTTFPKYP